jgi:competence protein ComEC
MYVGLIYLLLPDIPFISSALGLVLEKSILLMNKVLTLIEHLPYSGINKIWITTSEYVLLYIIIISLFYFLYDKKSWLLKLALCSTLVLVCMVSFKRLGNLQSDRITFLNLRKHTGVVFQSGEHGAVISDLADTDKTYRYSVQPFLDSSQVKFVHSIIPTADGKLSFLLKRGNLIQFQDKKLLIFDKQLQGITMPGKLELDYLLVSGNPQTDIDFINRNYSYGLLVIDNNNSKSLIASLKDQAIAGHINYRMMERNKSFTLVSN